ncbi:MAG: hypothetical protein ACRELB_25845, partial [Polyangiaceae bacterium]
STSAIGVPPSPTHGISAVKLHTCPSHDVALASCGWQRFGSTGEVVVVKAPQPKPAPLDEPELEAPPELEPLEPLDDAPPEP